MILNFIINFGAGVVLAIGLIYIGLVISAIYLLIRNEKGLMLLVWLLVVLSLPFLGSLLYLTKYALAGKPGQQA